MFTPAEQVHSCGARLGWARASRIEGEPERTLSAHTTASAEMAIKEVFKRMMDSRWMEELPS